MNNLEEMFGSGLSLESYDELHEFLVTQTFAQKRQFDCLDFFIEHPISQTLTDVSMKDIGLRTTYNKHIKDSLNTTSKVFDSIFGLKRLKNEK